MAYTLGVIENALQQLKDRIDTYRAAGETLEDIKQVYIGARPMEMGANSLPIIIINCVSLQDDTTTMAYSGGQKTAKLSIEIRVVAEKLMEDAQASYSTNVLFDGNGKGGLAYFQWLVDALVFETDSTYKPSMTLSLDTYPDIGFSWEETSKNVEIFGTLDFDLRYTLGGFGGVIT